MANMHGIFKVVNVDDHAGAIPQHINFSFRDSSSNNNCVVNAVSILYLITSPNKNTARRIKSCRLRGSITSKFHTVKSHTECILLCPRNLDYKLEVIPTDSRGCKTVNIHSVIRILKEPCQSKCSIMCSMSYSLSSSLG